MNDLNDYGEFMGNNNRRLMREFLEENADNVELLNLALEYATRFNCYGLEVEEVLEAAVHTDGSWSKKYDAYCEGCWESARTPHGEPEDLEDR